MKKIHIAALLVLLLVWPSLFAWSSEPAAPLSRDDGQAESYSDEKTGMEFVRVAGGCFQMGVNPGDDEDETPAHEVCLKDISTQDLTW